jgi:D-aminoacyl-tRNA deacylase
VLQRVREASVTVDEVIVGSIGRGLLAFVGVASGDTDEDAAQLGRRVATARLFASENRDFDQAVGQVGGAVLCISQFTVFADLRRGNRPSWDGAAPPAIARRLVTAFAEAIVAQGVEVAHGEFGAQMVVKAVGDGPVTLVLDSTPSGERRRSARP